MKTEQTPVPPDSTRPSHLGRNLAILVALLAVAGGGYFLYRTRTAAAQAKAGGGAGKGGAPGERRVPVLVEAAVKRDVPIVLEGLGTVTPLATVQMRSQVDGRLISVGFKEGALVKKGELLAQIDPRPFQIALAQTAATLARDAAQQRNAKLLLERDKSLREQSLLPQQTVDDQQTLVDQLEGTLGIDQAANDNAKLNLEYSRIVSPIDGVTGIRQIDPGNLVHASDPAGLVVITQLDPISVIFTVPQDELDRLQKAMGGGTLQVEAWSRDGRTLLATGALAVIDNQISATTATIKLKATFPNPQRALWPNQFIKARLTVDQKRGALVIAAAAIQRGPQGTFVYLAAPDNTAQLKPVDVDLIEGPLAVLRGGINEGDKVITDGMSQLKPGAAIDARMPGPVAEAGGALK